MIEYSKGDLFDSDCQALVNTVNLDGIMGKGIALQFKQRYPRYFKIYQTLCKEGLIKMGRVHVMITSELFDNKTLISFPTKTHWWLKSEYKYIEVGLRSLRRTIKDHEIKSIAIPALGCGNGGLDWDQVKTLIESKLGKVNAKIIVYEPV